MPAISHRRHRDFSGGEKSKQRKPAAKTENGEFLNWWYFTKFVPELELWRVNSSLHNRGPGYKLSTNHDLPTSYIKIYNSQEIWKSRITESASAARRAFVESNMSRQMSRWGDISFTDQTWEKLSFNDQYKILGGCVGGGCLWLWATFETII